MKLIEKFRDIDKRVRIHTKLLFPIIGLIVLTTIALSSVVMVHVKQSLEEVFEKNIIEDLTNVTELIKRQGEALTYYAKTISDLIADKKLMNSSYVELQKELLPLKTKFILDYLEIINAGGIEILNLDEAVEQTISRPYTRIEKEEEEVYKFAMNGMNFYTAIEKPAGLLLVAVSPIYQTGDNADGVLIVGNLLGSDFFNRIKSIMHVDIGLFGKNGKRYGATFYDSVKFCTLCHIRRKWGSKVIPSFIHELPLLSGETVYITPPQDGFKYGFEPLRLQGEPIAMISIKQKTESLNHIQEHVLFTSGFTVLVSLSVIILLISVITRKITKPFADLSAATKRISEGDLSQRINLTTGKEVLELSEAFNVMIRNLNASRAEIEDLNKGLEEKVAKRTEELTRLSQEMRHIQTTLIEYERLAAVGELTAVIAHEIRNPLNSLSINLGILRRALKKEALRGEDGNENEKVVNMIAHEINRINDAVENLLRFSKKPILKKSYCNIGEIVKSVVDLLDEEAKRSQVTFTVNVDHDIPEIYVDSDQIRQVILNLILNSMQAIKDSGEIKISVSSDEQKIVLITIHDTGIGIKMEDVDKVFQPFHTTKEKGTGLGLSIVKKIIENHNGTITCESEFNRGTTFAIEIPIEYKE